MLKEYTLKELSQMLERGETTSEKLTAAYLMQIGTYDPYLKSVGELLPNPLEEARKLDEERKEKGPRSKLHGIPILIKDNINALAPLHTCAGSHALSETVAPYEATVAKKLREAGMLILGKANLSEFAYFMSSDAPCGFSSQFGQVKSPYDENLDPLGSSTGSAVAVAANLIPVAIGSETNGSLMSPAYANSIVSLKPTLGMVSRYGILPITADQDTAGPMSRTVADSAMLMDVLYGSDENDKASMEIPKRRYAFEASLDREVAGMKIGILKFEKDQEYMTPEKEAAYEILRRVFEEKGAEVVDLTLETRRVRCYECMLHEYKRDLNAYLASMGEAVKLHTLKEIIEFNKLDPARNMPYGQDILEAAEEKSGTCLEEEYLEMKHTQLEEAGKLEKLMLETGVDAAVTIDPFPHGAIYGNPTLAVPAKALTDAKPMSAVFVAPKWQDDVLFTFAKAYEEATKFRQAPDLTKLPSAGVTF